MSKLSYEDKINIYDERKQGNNVVNISKKYDVRKDVIKYLIRLIDKHGYDILRTNKNRNFSKEEKERIINRVLINNESACSVAIDEGLLSQGMLQNWIKKYNDMGYNIVERKRGRSPTMNKKDKPKKSETIEEENERLKKENLYLKAELEYSKKLRAV
ncbi:MAG: transposase, partial [Bacilli bacterium]|nr:transposase [Bacilli bacterium]